MYRLLRLFVEKSERTHAAAPPFQPANAPLAYGLRGRGIDYKNIRIAAACHKAAIQMF